MILRAPEPSEAPALTGLVMRSKASHGYDADFMAKCRDALTVRPHTWGLPQLAEDGALLGYVELHTDTATINHLFVTPEAQGKGFGRALFTWACDTARSTGLTRLTLEADPFAEAFYAKLGARTYAQQPSTLFPGRSLPLMEIHLR